MDVKFDKPNVPELSIDGLSDLEHNGHGCQGDSKSPVNSCIKGKLEEFNNREFSFGLVFRVLRLFPERG